MKKKTKIILAATAGIQIMVSAVIAMVKILADLQIDWYIIGIGMVGVVGIFLAAKAEMHIPKPPQLRKPQ